MFLISKHGRFMSRELKNTLQGKPPPKKLTNRSDGPLPGSSIDDFVSSIDASFSSVVDLVVL